MKMYQLERARAQISKIRGPLGLDSELPVESIVKPVGMRTKRFEQLIARLKTHEKMTVTILTDGFKKWERSNIYNL